MSTNRALGMETFIAKQKAEIASLKAAAKAATELQARRVARAIAAHKVAAQQAIAAVETQLEETRAQLTASQEQLATGQQQLASARAEATHAFEAGVAQGYAVSETDIERLEAELVGLRARVEGMQEDVENRSCSANGGLAEATTGDGEQDDGHVKDESVVHDG